MQPTDRDRIFLDPPRSPYLWCMHCERTYDRGKYRTIDGLQMCPYLGCDGDAVIDAWDWERVRDYHPHYPERPRIGEVFPYDPI